MKRFMAVASFLALAFFAGMTHAQSEPPYTPTGKAIVYTLTAGVGNTTQVGVTLGSANTFQSVLSALSTRRGCIIENTSGENEYLFIGANASATTSNAFQLKPLGFFFCNGNGQIVTDNISMAGTSTSSDTVVVSSQ